MPITNKETYEKAKAEVEEMQREYEALRSTEAAQPGGANREKLKSMMQPMNDLRDEVFKYEVKMGLRPDSILITTREVR